MNSPSVQAAEQERLSTKRVLLIGCGSVASFMAMCLVQYVQLTQVDPSKLSKGNIKRHLAGKDMVGAPKVDAVHRVLMEHFDLEEDNHTPIVGYGLDVLLESEEFDLVVESTDSAMMRHDLNVWSIQSNTPTIYTGVYDGGTGWQTIVLPRPREVCYHCTEASRVNTVQQLEEQPTYGENRQPPRFRELHGASGLITAVMEVAGRASQQVLDLLQNSDTEPYLYRHTDVSRPFLHFNDQAGIQAAQYAVRLQGALGVEQFELIEENGGFTLYQKPGSIQPKIRQAPDCVFHMAQ